MPRWRAIAAELQCQEDQDADCPGSHDEPAPGPRWEPFVRGLLRHARQDDLVAELMSHTMTRIHPDASGIAPRKAQRPLQGEEEEENSDSEALLEGLLDLEREQVLPERYSDSESSEEGDGAGSLPGGRAASPSARAPAAQCFPTRVRAAPVVVPIWKESVPVAHSGLRMVPTARALKALEDSDGLQTLESLAVQPTEVLEHSSGPAAVLEHHPEEAPPAGSSPGLPPTGQRRCRSSPSRDECSSHPSSTRDQTPPRASRESKVSPASGSSRSSASKMREFSDYSASDSDDMVPEPAFQVRTHWEYPLSRKEKQLRLVQVMDGARELAEQENRALKRRISLGARASDAALRGLRGDGSARWSGRRSRTSHGGRESCCSTRSCLQEGAQGSAGPCHEHRCPRGPAVAAR